MNLKQLQNNSIKELNEAGVKSAEVDVKVLLNHTLEKQDAYLFAHPEAPITNAQYQKFRRLIRKRKKGEPVAYLTGHKEFYGLDFLVNKNVLIPRPESEMLVEETIEFIKSKVHKVYKVEGIKRKTENGKRKTNIIDIGTGSGCIIVSLATTISSQLPSVSFFASDISEKALKVAKKNAKIHGVDDNIKFIKSDLLSNPQIPKQLDIIIANLPYIPSHKKYKDINYTTLSYEPKNALFGGKEGLDEINKLLKQISIRPYKPKLILLEIFEDQAHKIQNFAQKYLPDYQIKILKDLAGLIRIISLQLPQSF